MSRKVRTRFWIEAALATLGAVLLVVTLITREWIEAVFGVDPDGGDGSLEWAIVAGLLVASVALGVVARTEWRRPTAAQPQRP
jgi:hypothetical protein